MALVTLRDAAGDRDVCAAGDVAQLLLAGEQLIDYLARCRPVPDDFDPGSVFGVLLVDLPRRTIHASIDRSGTVDEPLERRAAGHWPGWSVHGHAGGLERHWELCGRDASRFRRPADDLIAALRRIATFTSRFDPAAALATLRAAGMDVQVADSSYFEVHRPGLSAEERGAIFDRLVQTWRESQPKR
jgi:hypothetical protein